MNIPSTVDRTPQHTAAHVNREIRYRTEQSIARCAAAGRDSINNRLDELDDEWDVERTLEATAASSFLLALLLGASAGWFWHGVRPWLSSDNSDFAQHRKLTTNDMHSSRYVATLIALLLRGQRRPSNW
jgi:hypothetical protein